MKALMKRIISVSLIGIIALFVFAGCGNKNVDTSVDDIRARGVLKVAIPNYDTTLLYYDNSANAYRGLEAEVIDVIAQALDVKVEYIPCTREQMYNMILVGSADLAIGYIDEQSSNIGNLSKTISYGGENLYVVSPRGVYVGNLSLFSGKVIGVSSLIDPAAYGAVYTSGSESVLLYSDTQSVIDAFHNGNISGYICYRSEGEALTASGEFQIQSCNDLSKETFTIVAAPTSNSLINGCNNHIEAYLDGKEVPVWVEEKLKQEKENSNSLFE